ncbi:MAG TPA: DUF4288 domain-containing protein [Candidatus Angelobacter sp.]
MWYSVSTFAVAQRDQHSVKEPLWEEQIFLVDAESENDAKHKAELLAQRDECEYTVRNGSSLTWRFNCVSKVYKLPDEDIRDGVEIFSRFLKDSEAKSLLNPIE